MIGDKSDSMSTRGPKLFFATGCRLGLTFSVGIHLVRSDRWVRFASSRLCDCSYSFHSPTFGKPMSNPSFHDLQWDLLRVTWAVLSALETAGTVVPSLEVNPYAGIQFWQWHWTGSLTVVASKSLLGPSRGDFP